MDAHTAIPAAPFSLSASARFWEPRRALYNLVLAAVAVVWLALDWPHFRPAITWSSLPKLALLALLANLCYTAAYAVDAGIQRFATDSQQRWRWAFWLLGTLFAILVESYWINDEIYPGIPHAASVLLRSILP